MELWDAYKEDGTLAGRDLIRVEPIPDGLYHLVCEILVKHTDGSYLLMQRDYNKEVYPGMFEASAGGSVVKGETAVDGAIRELKEETGITADKLTLINVGVNNKSNVIWYEYLCVTDCDKNSVTLQEGETIAYKWLSKDEFIEFINSENAIKSQIARLKPYLDDLENRIEVLRKYIDDILLNMTDTEERRCAYLHLYGVSQACALIALNRGENVELAMMAGMLHDFYTYNETVNFMNKKSHAENGAILAREILNELKLTSHEETDIICSAIYNHSSKGGKFSGLDEVLIDADVMQHCLYNFTFPVMEHEKTRFEKLVKEFSLKIDL